MAIVAASAKLVGYLHTCWNALRRLYRSIYAYSFDIADRGVVPFAQEALDLGLTDVSLAVSYHAGKFLRPRAAGDLVIFPEDGVVYFDPRIERYGEIKPSAHTQRAQRHVLADLLGVGKLRVHAWTVLLHNSRLGVLHPQFNARNVFGDRYLYSLCPMHDAVFQYALALCSDIATQHGVASLVLETPGWLPYAHGYHHEFAQVRSNLWLDAMLGICFCSACQSRLATEGADAGSLRDRVAKRIRGYLTAPVDAEPDQASSRLSAELIADPELLLLIQIRQRRVSQLVAAIRAAVSPEVEIAVIPTVQRPTALSFLEGSDLAALSKIANWLELPFYEPNAARVAADANQAISAIGGATNIRAILRPGPPDLAGGSELKSALTLLRAAGVEQWGFYNYGLLRPQHLEALGESLRAR